MQATRINADLSKKKKIRVYQRLKIRVIRVLFFRVNPLSIHFGTLINADAKSEVFFILSRGIIVPLQTISLQTI